MAKNYIFRPINENALRWHPELGEGERIYDYFEYLWIDGPLKGDDGKDYYLRLSPSASTTPGSHGAEIGGLPGIGFDILLPDGRVIDDFPVYEAGDFEPEKDGIGGIWHGKQVMKSTVRDNRVIGFDIDMTFKNVEIKLHADAVAGGVQFVSEKHGYTFYNEKENIATGWWPLSTCLNVTGSLKIEGNEIQVIGKFYLDRQVGNMKKNFGTGAQAWWTWGHFWAGEYSGTFTDSAPDAKFKYRHFSPFVLYKGKELVLATHDFVGYVEQYCVDDESGKFYPKCQSQRAIDGSVKFYSQILNGILVEPETTSLEATCRYVRQFADIKMQLMRFGGFRDDAEGKIVIEYGAGFHYMPFDLLK